MGKNLLLVFDLKLCVFLQSEIIIVTKVISSVLPLGSEVRLVTFPHPKCSRKSKLERSHPLLGRTMEELAMKFYCIPSGMKR